MRMRPVGGFIAKADLVHAPTMRRGGGCGKRAEGCQPFQPPPSASIGDAKGMAAEGDKTGSGLTKSRSPVGAMAEMPQRPPARLLSELARALTSGRQDPKLGAPPLFPPASRASER